MLQLLVVISDGATVVGHSAVLQGAVCGGDFRHHNILQHDAGVLPWAALVDVPPATTRTVAEAQTNRALC